MSQSPGELMFQSSTPCGSNAASQYAILEQGKQEVYNLIGWTAGLGFAGLAMFACALHLLHNPSEVRAFRKPWYELTEQEKRAAQTLGYREETWQRTSSPLEGKPWSSLTPQERHAAQTLGYTPATWKSQSAVNHGKTDRQVRNQSELEDMFVASQKEIVDKLNDNTPDDIKFEVYGYYKQAMEGDVRVAKPEPWNQRDVAKWNAWAQHRGMSRPQAIEGYIQLARRIPQS
jgi:acyl-CoA-binding protein